MEKEPFRLGLSKNETLTSLLREYQENPKSRVFAKLADEYRKQDLVIQAIEIIEEGLEFHPGFSVALFVKAQCFFDKRRYADCLKILGKLVRDNPQNYKAERLRADVFLRLGQQEAALDSLTRVVEMVPRDIESRKLLEELENLLSPQSPVPSSNSPASSDTALNWISEPAGDVSEFEVSDLGDLWKETIQESAPVIESELVNNFSDLPAESYYDEEVEKEPDEEEAQPNSLADPEFATRTVAELYLRQGLKEKAKQVLEIILKREPNNEWAQSTLDSVFSDRADSFDAKERQRMMVRAQVLERILKNISGYRKTS